MTGATGPLNGQTEVDGWAGTMRIPYAVSTWTLNPSSATRGLTYLVFMIVGTSQTSFLISQGGSKAECTLDHPKSRTLFRFLDKMRIEASDERILVRT